MKHYNAVPVLAFALCLSGCETPGRSSTQASARSPHFELSENAATQRLMASKYVARLQRAIPNRHLVCRVEGRQPDEVDLYLGDDEGDHTTRVASCRVTGDGRVWVNKDETGAEDRWGVVE